MSELWTEKDSEVETLGKVKLPPLQISTNPILVFRSKKCKTVYPDPGDDDSDLFICQSCSQSKPKRVKKPEVVPEIFTPTESAVEEIIVEEFNIEEEQDEAEYVPVVRTCPFENCNRTFKRKLPYENHIKTHRSKEKKVTKKIKRKKKKKTHPDKENYAHFCEPCQVGYNYEKSYFKHMKQHDKFICPTCKECFDSGETLESHTQSEHRKRERRKYPVDRQLRCDDCHETFPDLDSLSKHNIEHHGIHGDPCPVCGKYLKRSSMRNHLEKVHNSDNAR